MPTAAYDGIAGWYDACLREGSLNHDLALPAVLELADDLEGRHVCDLACGQGIVARALAHAGATVIGVDLSAALLAIARRYEREAPLGIVYQQDDAQTLATLADGAFDGVVCNPALMDMPDLQAVLGAVARVLKPRGWFVFSITHPCFQTPVSSWAETIEGGHIRNVAGYFAERFWRSENPDGVRGRVGAYHRTLATYLNGLREAGLALEQIREPRPSAVEASRVPGYAEVPVILAAHCRKGSGI